MLKFTLTVAWLSWLLAPAVASAQSALPAESAPVPGAPASTSSAPAAPSPGDDLTSAAVARPVLPRAEELPAATRQALSKGDAAVLARDYPAAISAYQDAVRGSPQSSVPHYRMGQAQALAGQTKEAELSYAAAVRFSAKNLPFRRKVLFCLAELAERERNYVLALERYSALASEPGPGEPEMPFAGSAIERKKRLLDRQQLASDSAQVKARVEKRLKQAEAAGRKTP